MKFEDLSPQKMEKYRELFRLVSEIAKLGFEVIDGEKELTIKKYSLGGEE